ncbi:hypothetical protein M3Y94_01168800 [Aphelenchoides besseyi]|nr:hypothetical protein M3Y94_01168800 [Aphelenchoides besseyi]KAI6228130.1 hypothetical protein M3Y95_00589900 [Aphelenchoides besseyi]
MPSLRAQLNNLQAPISKSLGVEKEHASLLFDRKEAASFNHEEFYNLGLAGLEQLRKFDRSFVDYEPRLFDSSSTTLNRAVLSKEEDEALNESLNRMIVYLSPYFHHQGCKQVLEWLIHKYHIHLFNSHVLANAFLVYHSTNSFGRLLKIMKLERPEWQFAKEFSADGLPIPFNSILRSCFKGGNQQFFVAAYAQFLQQAVQLVGAEYVGTRLQNHFTFFTSVVVHLFEDPANITDQLISRIMPFLGTALRSKILPYKLSGFIIVCDLVMNTTLNEDTVQEILKLIMIKMRDVWFEQAMNTIFVICQRQPVVTLPKKVLMKLLRKGESLNVDGYLGESLEKFDLTGFVVPFVNTALDLLVDKSFNDASAVLLPYLKIVLSLETMNDIQAATVIRGSLEKLAATEDADELPDELGAAIKRIAIRFADTFDSIRAEQMLTGGEQLNRLMERCKISTHEVGILNLEQENKKKRRRRSSHSRNFDENTIENADAMEVPTSKKIPKADEQLKNVQKSAEVRKKFKKSPMFILDMLGSSKPDREELEWALKSLQDSSYLSKQTTEDLEDYFTGVVIFISKNKESVYRAQLKMSLTNINLFPLLLVSLISPAAPNAAKRSRHSTQNLQSRLADESDEQFEVRLIFVLELFSTSMVIKPSAELIQHLFGMVEITDKPPRDFPIIKNSLYVQQLTLVLLSKFLKQKDALKLVGTNVQFEPLVNAIRFTHDQSVLRNALKVLTAVASLIPTQLTTQIMSLFAFMGDGLLKKDNELTLMVVEEALRALLFAMLNSQPGQDQLLEVSRIFAKALPDIPAHRRPRILRSLATCVEASELWLIFATIFDNICVQWKAGKTKNKPNNEYLDEICLDFVTTLPPEQQLSLALDLLDYVIWLGGETKSTTDKTHHYSKIFDRNVRPAPVLKHYRYMIVGFVLKMSNQKSLFDELCKLSDDEIYRRASTIGKRMLETLGSLSEFVSSELTKAENEEQKSRGTTNGAAQLQALKYWIALSARADIIAERLRCILPANVSGHIMCDLLDEGKLDPQLRDRALQLLNTKLVSESNAQNHTEGEMNEYLSKLATKLNDLLVQSEEDDAIVLCQHAAFSLKLLVKRLNNVESQTIFAETLDRCSKLLNSWSTLNETMIGSILLLVGELIRSTNVRSSVAANVDLICRVCLEILGQSAKQAAEHVEQLEEKVENEKQDQPTETAPGQTVVTRRQRNRSFSMSGRQYGDDVLFICALTVTQRLIENVQDLVTNYVDQFVLTTCHLCACYLSRTADGTLVKMEQPTTTTNRHLPLASNQLATIRHRLQQICDRLISIDIGVLVDVFGLVIKKIIKRPLRLAIAASLLESALQKANAEQVQPLAAQLVSIFLNMLDIRRQCSRKADQENLTRCEQAISRFFIAIADHLSELELTPVFSDLSDWVSEAMESETTEKDRWRVLSVYDFVNRFYETYNTIALTYFPQLFSYSPKLLLRLNAAKTDAAELFINGTENDTLEAVLADRLITSLLVFISNCARHRAFMDEDRAEVVYEAVLDELENRKVQGHEQRCVEHVATCTYYLGESAPDLFTSAICNKLLEKLHNRNARIRFRTVLVFDKLIGRIGDALAPMLPTVVQYLSEILEDPDPKVSQQCDLTIRRLRNIFGEDIMSK